MMQITEKVPFNDHRIWGGPVPNILASIQGSCPALPEAEYTTLNPREESG